MAPIKCRECGSEITSLAPACPKCGCPTQRFLPSSVEAALWRARFFLLPWNWLWVCIGLVVFLFIVEGVIGTVYTHGKEREFAANREQILKEVKAAFYAGDNARVIELADKYDVVNDPELDKYLDLANTTLRGSRRETAFISLIQSYASRYSSAPNELKKTTVRMERRESLAALVTDMQVSQWTGTLKKMSTNQEGDASIEIELDGDPPITLRTDINPFDDALIAYGSRLYNKLSALSVGDKVIFSGNFLPSGQDHIKETSLTELGAMGEPEFVMRFSDVTAASALASPSPAPETSPEPVPSTAASPAPNTSSSVEFPSARSGAQPEESTPQLQP